MSEFKPFDDRLNGLIAALSPAARRRLAGEIAKELRKSQQQRIKLQKAPDGSLYQARKRQPLRAKTGRIKRAMFQKLRTSRYMKATGRENSAVVEFTGKVQRIAQVHQYGLKALTRTAVTCSTRHASYSDSAGKINSSSRR